MGAAAESDQRNAIAGTIIVAQEVVGCDDAVIEPVPRPEARAAQDRFLKWPKVAISCGF